MANPNMMPMRGHDSRKDREGDPLIEDLDDWHVIHRIEKVYSYLVRMNDKIFFDQQFAPNYEDIKQQPNPMTPDISGIGIRNNLFEAIFYENSSWQAFIWYCTSITFVILSLFALVFDKVDTFMTENTWFLLEAASTAFFTVELLIQIGAVQNRCIFLTTMQFTTDFLGTLPFFLEIVLRFSVSKEAAEASWISVFRLFKLFRLGKIRGGLNIYAEMIGTVLISLKNLMFGIILYLFSASLLIGTCVHVVEPDIFHSIPHGMWFAIVTVTTVGYGDISPETPLGMMVATCGIVFGLCLLSIILMCVGQMYQDQVELLKDSLDEIKDVLYDKKILGVTHGDDLCWAKEMPVKDMALLCVHKGTVVVYEWAPAINLRDEWTSPETELEPDDNNIESTGANA